MNEAPDFFTEDLIKRIEMKTFGYEFKEDKFYDSFIHWNKKRHKIEIEKSEIYEAPSVLTAISILVNILTDEGDKILYQPPVYYPFLKIIKSNRRKAVKNSLKYIDNRYEIDFDDLEEKTKDSKVKLLIMANPHNPVGRVYTKEELKRVLEICVKNNVLIISDEIHRDILIGGRKFYPMSEINKKYSNRVITLLSPGKTFNISSLTTAVTLIKDEGIQKEYREFTERLHININNALSNVGFKSMYEKGEEWFEEFLIYLDENINYLREYMEENIPGGRVIEMEGGYLAWIDLNYLEIDAKELAKVFLEEGKVAFDFGHWFGREGAGFIRINLACTREILKDALKRLKKTIELIEKRR